MSEVGDIKFATLKKYIRESGVKVQKSGNATLIAFALYDSNYIVFCCDKMAWTKQLGRYHKISEFKTFAAMREFFDFLVENTRK